MNTISAKEIKRRGIAAVDEALKSGPVHVIKNNKPQYVVLTEEEYQRLAGGALDTRDIWDWLERPARGSRTREEIDAYLREEHDSWGDR